MHINGRALPSTIFRASVSKRKRACACAHAKVHSIASSHARRRQAGRAIVGVHSHRRPRMPRFAPSRGGRPGLRRGISRGLRRTNERTSAFSRPGRYYSAAFATPRFRASERARCACQIARLYARMINARGPWFISRLPPLFLHSNLYLRDFSFPVYSLSASRPLARLDEPDARSRV